MPGRRVPSASDCAGRRPPISSLYQYAQTAQRWLRVAVLAFSVPALPTHYKEASSETEQINPHPQPTPTLSPPPVYDCRVVVLIHCLHCICINDPTPAVPPFFWPPLPSACDLHHTTAPAPSSRQLHRIRTGAAGTGILTGKQGRHESRQRCVSKAQAPPLGRQEACVGESRWVTKLGARRWDQASGLKVCRGVVGRVWREGCDHDAQQPAVGKEKKVWHAGGPGQWGGMREGMGSPLKSLA